MKVDPVINQTLNAVLNGQLTTINQLFLHARMIKNWGLTSLNQHEYKLSIQAMKLADDLIERILLLEGLPNLQDLGKLYIGEDVPEILSNDLMLQSEVRAVLVEAIGTCEKAQDYASREILEKILEETEEHIDWLEAQQWLIDKSGLQNYLQSQI
ncbi:bacterioferritin [Candidatus Thiodiazotropha sp. CDECU1]|uniref:bacterioferritin n=1 Tax=Candidatus Thiodiazotropha sp. CDECU1 TaxID=3065865 RepID=UPI00292F49B1|nr:bacterioferritin [Candidatus Thiodiazotropha sp. CDECU1]